MIIKNLIGILKTTWLMTFVCRLRGYLFRLVDHRLTDHYLERKRFREMTGYDLNLHEPESFNHKVIWKKFNDRNPLLPVVADKYKVREHVKKVFGEDIAKEILIPLYYVTKDPETIPFTKLPDEYVIKANHNSGPPIFIGQLIGGLLFKRYCWMRMGIFQLIINFLCFTASAS